MFDYMQYSFFEKDGKDLYVVNKQNGDRHKVILLTLGGSHAYGTNVKDSDIDIRGIALRTREEILLGRDFEQFINEETDTVIYSFDKICSLLSKCNPNTIEILGCQEYLYLDSIGEKLLENREIFLSKIAIQSFGGYANAQLHRLKNRSIRGVGESEREQHILKSIENANISLRERYQEMGDGINLYIDKAVNPDMDTEIFMDVNLKHYPLRDYKDYWSEMNSIVKSYKKIGKRNSNAYSRGKIYKHCMHLIRLYYMLFDILELEIIRTYRPEREFLLQVRDGLFFDGEVPKDELFEYIDQLEANMKRLKGSTTLPDKPNYDKINKLIISVNEEIVNVH